MVEHVDSVRVNTKEEVHGLVSLHNQLGVALNDHVGGALVEFNIRMLHLSEHECLGGGQNEGHHPGAEHHQPEEDQSNTHFCQL